MSDFRFFIITLYLSLSAFIASSYIDAKRYAATSSETAEIVNQCIAAYMADPVNIPPVCKEYLK